MGCTFSKIIDKNSIPYKLQKTNNASIDQVFSQIECLLAEFEQIRLEGNLSYQEMLNISDANKLELSNLSDSVIAFLWCLSAINEDKLTVSDISLSKNSPYLEMNYYSYSSEMTEFCLQFQKFLEIMNEYSDEKRLEMITEILSLQKTIQQNFNKSIEGVSTNFKIIQYAVEQIKNLNNFFKSLNYDLQNLYNQFNDMVEKANEQGKICKTNQFNKPAQCLQLCSNKTMKPKQLQKKIGSEAKQQLKDFKKKLNELQKYKKKNNY